MTGQSGRAEYGWADRHYIGHRGTGSGLADCSAMWAGPRLVEKRVHYHYALIQAVTDFGCRACVPWWLAGGTLGGMPLLGLSHRVSFTFDTESEAQDCYARLEDALPDLAIEHRKGKNVLETWTVSSGTERQSTGPQIQSLADAAILFGPVEPQARKALEDELL